MAKIPFSATQHDIGELNSGNRYTINDQMSVEQLNYMIENSLFSIEYMKAMASHPDVSEIDGTGAPDVSLVDNIQNGQMFKKFKFSNLKGDKGDRGEKGEAGRGGNFYDLIITTQSEFEAFCNSLHDGTCESASILLVGDGGYSSFTYNDYLPLPSTIKKIDGLNCPILHCKTIYYDDYSYGSDMSSEFSISNLVVFSGGEASFESCKNIFNCEASGFVGCDNLVNCHATSKSYSFEECSNLVNCLATGNGTTSIGFLDCQRLVNCHVDGNAGFGYSGCSYLNNCTIDDASVNKAWSGANYFVDDKTCSMPSE